MFEAFKADPARAAGRFLASALFGVAYGRPQQAELADEEQAPDPVAEALTACMNRYASPSVIFEDRTRLALADANRLAGETPVDTKALLERIEHLRGRIALLERRGLEHLPEYNYLRAQSVELGNQWRIRREAQGESTAQRPAPPPAP